MNDYNVLSATIYSRHTCYMRRVRPFIREGGGEGRVQEREGHVTGIGWKEGALPAEELTSPKAERLKVTAGTLNDGVKSSCRGSWPLMTK